MEVRGCDGAAGQYERGERWRGCVELVDLLLELSNISLRDARRRCACELGADREQAVLDGRERARDCCARLMGEDDAERGVQLVERTDRFDYGVGLRDANPA